MDDLIKRPRVWPLTTPHDVKQDYSARIEELEAQLAKADALAGILDAAIIEHDTADYPPDAENPWVMQEWFSEEDRAILTEYRAAREKAQ